MALRTTINRDQIRDQEVFERHLDPGLLNKIFKDWSKFEYEATEAGENSVTIPGLSDEQSPPVVYLNGVLQHSNSYTISDETITFPQNFEVTDHVVVLYGKLPGILPEADIDLGIEAEFESFDITNITYNLNGDINEIFYSTGNKAAVAYNENSDVSNISFYDTDGVTVRKVKTLGYDSNSNLVSVTWS